MTVYKGPSFPAQTVHHLYHKEYCVREDDCGLIHKVEKFDELHEDEALESCSIQSIPWGNKEL